MESKKLKKTNKGGNLAKFSLISDEKGLIRIRGRIKHANLSFEQRYNLAIHEAQKGNSYVLRFIPRTQP